MGPRQGIFVAVTVSLLATLAAGCRRERRGGGADSAGVSVTGAAPGLPEGWRWLAVASLPPSDRSQPGRDVSRPLAKDGWGFELALPPALEARRRAVIEADGADEDVVIESAGWGIDIGSSDGQPALAEARKNLTGPEIRPPERLADGGFALVMELPGLFSTPGRPLHKEWSLHCERQIPAVSAIFYFDRLEAVEPSLTICRSIRLSPSRSHPIVGMGGGY